MPSPPFPDLLPCSPLQLQLGRHPTVSDLQDRPASKSLHSNLSESSGAHRSLRIDVGNFADADLLEAASIVFDKTVPSIIVLILQTQIRKSNYGKLLQIMNRLTALRLLSVLPVLFTSSVLAAASATADAQESKDSAFLRAHRTLQMGMGGGGHMGGGGGMGMGGGRSDMATIHNLIDNRHTIQRIVNITDDGIRSTTWSENEEVSAWIKQHVAEMSALLESSSGRIRQWDDLFAKVFDLRDSHTMQYHDRDDKMGVDVEQYGINKCAIGLVQAHAEVVSAFIDRGYEEVHKNHDVPAVCDETEEESQSKVEVKDENADQSQADDDNDISIAPGDGDDEEENGIIADGLLLQPGKEKVDTSISLEDNANEPEDDVNEEERQILSFEQGESLALSRSSANDVAAGLSLIWTTTSAMIAVLFVVLIH